jgi:hypothetical protein
MKLLPLLLAAMALATLQPAAARTWEIASPDHEQTYAFGSERHRQWMNVHGHLAIAMGFTNDPYVDTFNPRQYDDFIFDFPDVTLGPDGKTFYYHPAAKGPAIPAAEKRPGFFGEDVTLLPSSFLVVDKPHGLISLTLLVDGRRGDIAQR